VRSPGAVSLTGEIIQGVEIPVLAMPPSECNHISLCFICCVYFLVGKH